MSVELAWIVFTASLAVCIISSMVLAERIDQMGTWLGLSEGLLGLLTALAADAPEIAAAITAIAQGNHDLGLGVVFGSNVFNIAALLGLGAIVSGSVRVGLAGLWFDGGVGLAIALLAALRIFGWMGNFGSALLLGAVLLPYLLISALKPEHLDRIAIRPHLHAMLRGILSGRAHEKRMDQTPEKPSVTDLLGTVPALVAVVIASVGMVNAAVVLGHHWGISQAVTGMLVLASLTGLPNAFAAVRLARRGRGTAVLSETLNSNSVNILVGALLPVFIFGTNRLTSQAIMAIVWSIAMTALALVLGSLRGGLTRRSGIILVVVYAAFAIVVLSARR